MYKILIADDNKQIVSILKEYSNKEGYTTITAYDGDETLSKFKLNKPDLILLDVMMPNIDGFQICREIRKFSNVPIIMITARGEDFERILGLDIGADDYIIKPFSPGEVMARIRAILRRISKSDETTNNKLIKIDNLTIDINLYTAYINNNFLSLTKKEFEILWILASNNNKIFSRDNLLTSLWGYDYLGDSRTVDSHIKRLRAKLDTFPHSNWEIKTIWGIGYKFEVYNDHK